MGAWSRSTGNTPMEKSPTSLVLMTRSDKFWQGMDNRHNQDSQRNQVGLRMVHRQGDRQHHQDNQVLFRVVHRQEDRQHHRHNQAVFQMLRRQGDQVQFLQHQTARCLLRYNPHTEVVMPVAMCLGMSKGSLPKTPHFAPKRAMSRYPGHRPVLAHLQDKAGRHHPPLTYTNLLLRRSFLGHPWTSNRRHVQPNVVHQTQNPRLRNRSPGELII